MSRIQDFDLDVSQMRYNLVDIAISSVYLLISIGATLAVSIVLIACIRREISPTTFLLLTLCWADFLFGISVLIVTAVNLSYGHFAIGQIGCIIDGALVCFSCGLSIFSLFFLTLERCILFYFE